MNEILNRCSLLLCILFYGYHQPTEPVGTITATVEANQLIVMNYSTAIVYYVVYEGDLAARTN